MTHLNLQSKIKILGVAFGIVLSIGCGKTESLSPLETVYQSVSSDYSVKVNFCTDPAYEQKQYLKTVIVLDHSGSNQQNYLMIPNSGGVPDISGNTITIDPIYGTDPTGRTRYGDTGTPGTLLNYLSTLPANDPADPDRFFALVNFESSASTYPTGSSGFTSNIPAFYSRVLQDSGQPNSAPSDNGGTDYLKALDAAYSIISNDIQQAKNCAAKLPTANPTATCPRPGTVSASSYVIVFMSDGSPITQINFTQPTFDNAGNMTAPAKVSMVKQATDQILTKAAAIASLISDTQYVAGVNLFSIYYYMPGNIDDSAQALLSLMAQVGNGVFYNALSGSNIDYSRFQPPQKRIRFNLSDIFVTNSSAAWDQENLVADTDQDGLSDDLEIAWGSNPNQASTHNNGVSDLVQYRYAGGNQIKTPANYRTGICAGVPQVSGVYRLSDPNGLNDCEKLILNNIIGNPDSNSDLIPDWLELKHGIPFQLGTAPAVNAPDQDGFSIYDKIKKTLPLSIPVSQLLNPKPARYKTQLLSSNGSQDCYGITVLDFPVVSNHDTVRVDIIMKSDLLRQSYLYRRGEKSFSPGSRQINFNDWTDSTEQLNNTWMVWP